MKPEDFVVNKHHRKPYDVYIGRGSMWGNPFVIGTDGDRGECVVKYEEYLLGNAELMSHLPELRGKVLCCYCAPKPCHGHVLARYANDLM